MKSSDVALLRALHSSAAHQLPGDLCEALALSQAALGERLEALSAAGFGIERHPTLGVRLVSTPDRLVADDLLARIVPGGLIREIVLLAETDSTNNRAADAGRIGAAAGLVIFAEAQSAGRGRFGRAWASASHRGLWFSLLLRPEFPFSLWPRLTTWTAVALARAIEAQTGCLAQIKWPNDVFLDGRKVAGILIETGVDASGAPFAVVGIGLNVNQTTVDFPEELRSRATSIRKATDHAIDRPALAAAILDELHAQWPLLADSFPQIVSEAERRSVLIGKWVAIKAGEEVSEGFAEGLDSEGLLLLRDGRGEVHAVNAGEATLLTGIEK